MGKEATSEARRLVQGGASDERIEALTGLSLMDILSLRASAATTQTEWRTAYFIELAHFAALKQCGTRLTGFRRRRRLALR